MTRPADGDNPFEIRDRPLPVHTWGEDDGPDRLGVITRDVGDLLRRLGEATCRAEELRTDSHNHLRKHLLAMLDVKDDFERIFTNIEGKRDQVTRQMKKWIANFRTVSRKFKQVLEDEGVVPIENLDAGFDPRWHKVAETVCDLSKREGTIVEVVRPGYMWRGEVLRKTEVVVVRNEQDDE